jgi:hypothetical protein
MSEPDVISQSAEPFTDDLERQKWFRQCAVDAEIERGVTWCRYSIHPEHGWCLFEGWKVKPEDEGEPRWQIAAPPAPDEPVNDEPAVQGRG